MGVSSFWLWLGSPTVFTPAEGQKNEKSKVSLHTLDFKGLKDFPGASFSASVLAGDSR